MTRASITAVMRRVAEERGLNTTQLTGPGRGRNRISHVRQDAMRAVSEETGASNGEIGRAFNRDHSTVAHGIAASRTRADFLALKGER